MTIPDIRPSSQDTSAFYLAHIYQQSSTQPNGSRPSIPSRLSDPTEPFSPPSTSVWVNGLWFSSLVISLSCALLATLLLQWARRYERVAYPRHSPHKRARIRAFYKRGVERWRIPRAVEVLPMLLHISLFLFFAGLSVFLSDANHTIFKAVIVLISLIVVAYACLSLFPVIHKNSLYSTPLSVLFSFCLTGIRYLFFRLQGFPRIGDFIRMLLPSRQPGKVHLDGFFSRSMIRTAEEYAFKLNPDIDHLSLWSTFESLEEDAELEEFFARLPRLCDSETGRKLKLEEEFIKPKKNELSKALNGLMDHTLKSSLVEESVKHRRMIVFTKAIESKSTSLLDPSLVLRRVLLGDWHRFLECIDFGLSMHKWANTSNDDRVTSFYAQCVATLAISIIQDRDKRWIQLATVHGHPLSKSLHHHHHEDYQSLLLTNLIYVVRMSVQTYSMSDDTHRKDVLVVSRRTLAVVCKLDIQHTLPELQHEFCHLWNKLVDMAGADQRLQPHPKFVSLKMLKNIRKLYIALHDTPRTDFHTVDDWEQVLDNPGFYLKCTEKGHKSSSSFRDLQVGAPQTPSQANVPSPTHMPLPSPGPPTSSIAASSSVNPSPSFPVPEPYDHAPQTQADVPSPSDMHMPVSQPHSPPPVTLSNPTPSQDRPSPPSSPVPKPHDHPSQTQADVPSPSDMHMPVSQPHSPPSNPASSSIHPSPSFPVPEPYDHASQTQADVPSASDMHMLVSQSVSPPPLTPSNPAPSPDQPSSLPFPVPKPYDHASQTQADVSSPSDMYMPVSHPHSQSPLTPSNPASSLDHPPSPSYPVPIPHDPPRTPADAPSPRDISMPISQPH